MKLSGFVTGVWLVWLLLIIGKVSVGVNPKAIKQISKDCTRALCVIAGAYVARVASDDCSEDADMAFAFTAFASTVAVAVDAAYASSAGQWVRPGTAAVLSATTITTAHAVLREPSDCYSVAAPAMVIAALVGIALGSVRKHI